ncbi:hypothetical protein BUY24_10135, partial [Staphylococcus cohnii]
MNRLDGKTVITIIGVIGLMIFAFIFTIGYILSNIDPENKLEGYTIAISFIGIFATFGGAYLGAKISGENASKIANNQMIMDDLKTYSINNRNFLKDFDENIDKVLIKKIHNKRELEKAVELQNYKLSIDELNRKVVKCGIKYDDELSHSVFYPFELYRIKLYYLKDYLNNIENKMVKKYEEIIYKEISKEFNQDVDKNHLILKEYDNFNKVFLEPNRDNSVNFVECRIEIIQNEVTIL